jgi:cell division protein FtsB
VEGETTYTVDEAAEILQETPERIEEMLATGVLDGIPPGGTLSGEWKVLLPTSAGESAESAPEDPDEDQEEAPVTEVSVTGESAEEFVDPPGFPPPDAEEGEETPPASEELSRGDNAANDREPTAPSGWVSTQQAARALGISPRTVRWHIEKGNLQAKTEGEGVKRSWLVSIDSLHAFRNSRQDARKMPRPRRGTAESPGTAAESSGEAIRVLAERLEDAAARAAEYRVRLELTEQTESTLRAELDETRRRRDEVERERDQLRRELDALREAQPQEARESLESSAPTETPSTQGEDAQEAREATQSAAETLRGPEPRPSTGGAQEGIQRSPQPGRRRGRLWRRVFGG